MSRMSWLRGLLQRRTVEREIDDELAFHVEMQTQAHIERGMDPVEARRTALSAFGGTVQTKEMIRDVRTLRIESVWQDIRYAVRSLRTSPGFALAAILTLGLGIGLNVSLFTVFNVLALQTWDVQSPREVVLPFARPVGKRTFSNWLPYAEYDYLRDRTRTLSAVVARQRDSGRVFQAPGTDYDRPYGYAQFDGVSGGIL